MFRNAVSAPSKLEMILGLLPQTASFSSTVLSYLVVLGLGFAGFKYAQKKGVIVLENMAQGAAEVKSSRARTVSFAEEEPMDEEVKRRPPPRKQQARTRVARRN